MKKYLKDGGWANMPEILQQPEPFILVVGGRGVGKTYGSLKWCLENGVTFLYLRRTAAQMELVSKPEFSPILKVASDLGMVLTSSTISKYASGIYKADENGKPMGEPLAYVMALSTMANARSFDASRVQLILYDEAIPEQHEREISHESDAILNMYESINRNRELTGDDPVKLVVMANANNLEAPVLHALGAIRPLDKMRKTGQNEKHYKERGLCIILLNDSPVSANKSETALYKLARAGSDDFTDMALRNSFSADNYIDVRPRPLNEFKPVAAIGQICLYKHKSDGSWYVSETRSGDPEVFDNLPTERVRFQRKYLAAWQAYFDKKLTFESAPAKVFYKAVMQETIGG